MAVADRLIEIDVEIRWEYILHEDSSKVYTFDREMEDDEENEEPPKLRTMTEFFDLQTQSPPLIFENNRGIVSYGRDAH